MELRESPVVGDYDLAHLREIHRRIFQDLPEAGIESVEPGSLRPPVVPADQDWVKERRLESIHAVSYPVYSSMDAGALQRLHAVLDAISVTCLAALSEDAFTKALGDLYAAIDYIHPFRDGNSRTLREFTAQLARDAGYTLAWETFNTLHGRDVLYIARDISVNKLAFDAIRDPRARRCAQYTLDIYEHNKDITELLPEAITRMRAEGQEKT
jgi:cell filamentation protein